RFTTQGALWSIYGGLIIAVGLVLFSPVVSGDPTSMFPDVDFSWFPLKNPGLISIPAGFLLGWLGTVLSKEEPDTKKYAELEVRSLTGTGAHCPRPPRPRRRNLQVPTARPSWFSSHRAAVACRCRRVRSQVRDNSDPR